jgi:23S rRNA G2445 N2-methylase RlmL
MGKINHSGNSKARTSTNLRTREVHRAAMLLSGTKSWSTKTNVEKEKAWLVYLEDKHASTSE